MILFMLLLWILHFPLKNAAIVDIGWSFGLVFLSIFYLLVGPGDSTRKILLTLLVAFWGTRLGIHLLQSRIIGQSEEGRYQQLRTDWKTNIGFKFFLFFQFQAVLDLFLSIPFLIVACNPNPKISLVEYLGLFIGLISILGESIADFQLERFKSDPKNRGEVCQIGLWRYSRHPNYFFEWLIWISFFIFALGSPYGFISILCPILMFYFLFKVTGIPATEAQSIRSRGDKYRQYQQTTSAFIPWFPRKGF